MFRSGLAARNLNHMWAACATKNARNCIQMKHALPFLRLARFGFFAQPAPQDLGAILNSNALYTFSTGLSQIAFGCMLVFTSTEPAGANVLLPLSVSSASLFLSLVNIFLDFASILAELDEETRLQENIQTAANSDAAKKKIALEKKFSQQLEEVEQKFNDEMDKIEKDHKAGVITADEKRQREVPFFAMKKVAREHIQREYMLDLEEIETACLHRLRCELDLFRRKTKYVKRILQGPETVRDVLEESANGLLPIGKLQQKRKILQDRIHAIEKLYDRFVEEMDLESMTPDQVQQEMDKVRASVDKKKKVFQDELARLCGTGI